MNQWLLILSFWFVFAVGWLLAYNWTHQKGVLKGMLRGRIAENLNELPCVGLTRRVIVCDHIQEETQIIVKDFDINNAERIFNRLIKDVNIPQK